MMRYTIDGSDALESQIHEICVEIGGEIERIVPAHRLQALALAGGYGRGEGGVLRTEQGDRPYNDLEFFLLIAGSPRSNERKFGAAIHEMEHRMSEKLGIEVEFKISSLETLVNGPTSMFIYDLVAGHRIFAGKEDALAACRHHADASRIPMHEATRLLMNRCSGLLFAKERLERTGFSREDADFVARNIAKAQLAIGDSLLAVMGRYHWSCRERHQRLLQLDEPGLPMEEVRTFHQQGVEFKLHPVMSAASRESLATLHRDVSHIAWEIWKLIEGKRLGMKISTAMDYATHGNKCPETLGIKNALIRFRAFGWRGWSGGSVCRYPRESLLNTLPVLLWQPQRADSAWLSRQLVTPVAGWNDAVAAYQKLWSRYN